MERTRRVDEACLADVRRPNGFALVGFCWKLFTRHFAEGRANNKPSFDRVSVQWTPQIQQSMKYRPGQKFRPCRLMFTLRNILCYEVSALRMVSLPATKIGSPVL